ncbi:MAG: lysophospholipid acyltransferase family protein [Betaproteobacteria bacterium]|nr:MAG: lysophospholipid acyltransferase family protein [Betaproteobacteria bacterium]
MLFLLRLVARLPLPLLHALGAVLGWMVYLGSPRYRRDFKANLATAGLSGFRLRCSAVAEAGKSAMEVPAVWLRPLGRVAGLVVEVNGWEHVDAGARRGKGVIIVSPHIGCWEIVGQYVASRMPITVMYRTPKIRALEPLMRIGRGRGAAMKSITADVRGVRAMLKALKRGEAIGLLPDQVPGIGEGEWVEFFGRPAYTMTLVGRLSEQTGAPVLLCHAKRLPRGEGYRFTAEPLLAPRPPESPVRALNRSLEQLIRRCPEQYLWSYNRYKVPAGVRPPGG